MKYLLLTACFLQLCANTFAQTNQALSLNGSGQYLTLVNSASLTTNFTNKITIEAWIKVTATPTAAANIISSGNQNDFSLALDNNGKIYVSIYGIDVSGIGAFHGKSVVPLNAWHHIAVSYDGSTESIYLDGNLDTSRAGSGSIQSSSQAEVIAIGAYYGSGTYG